MGQTTKLLQQHLPWVSPTASNWCVGHSGLRALSCRRRCLCSATWKRRRRPESLNWSLKSKKRNRKRTRTRTRRIEKLSSFCANNLDHQRQNGTLHHEWIYISSTWRHSKSKSKSQSRRQAHLVREPFQNFTYLLPLLLLLLLLSLLFRCLVHKFYARKPARPASLVRRFKLASRANVNAATPLLFCFCSFILHFHRLPCNLNSNFQAQNSTTQTATATTSPSSLFGYSYYYYNYNFSPTNMPGPG